MLVLATFLAIGVFFVAFLLWFFSELQSEARLETERAERVKQIRSRRVPSSDKAHGLATPLSVAYSNPRLAQQTGRISWGPMLVAKEAARIKKEA